MEWAGGSGRKGTGRKWWSETARAVIPCLMSWREIVSNGGRSQRDSLSDWPFTIPCHIWPGNINTRPVLQHPSVSMWEEKSTHQRAARPARMWMHTWPQVLQSTAVLHAKESPFCLGWNIQHTSVSRRAPATAGKPFQHHAATAGSQRWLWEGKDRIRESERLKKTTKNTWSNRPPTTNTDH